MKSEEKQSVKVVVFFCITPTSIYSQYLTLSCNLNITAFTVVHQQHDSILIKLKSKVNKFKLRQHWSCPDKSYCLRFLPAGNHEIYHNREPKVVLDNPNQPNHSLRPVPTYRICQELYDPPQHCFPEVCSL